MSEHERSSEEADERAETREPLDPDRIRVVRAGHGANCSSVGSVIDALFLGAVVGTALFAAVAAALREEASDAATTKVDPPPSDVETHE